MAVSAKFVADFSNFLAAAKAAEGSLDKLAAASGVTEASVDKVGKAFKGENIIASATKAVQAVEAIGGASNLTESEMARVNRTITTAMDKMTRLGVQIPPEIQKIGKELDSALKPSVFERMTGGLEKFGLSLGAVSAGALLAFGKGAINAADNIGDIAEKTGLSTDAVQQFQQAFEGAGISIDEIAKSAAKLSAKVAGGSDSTEAALKALGLSMVDLQNKSPEEAFKLVAGALANVDDQGKKTLLANELLGKSMGMSAGAFNKANIEVMNHANLLGGESVEAAGDFNDAQTHLTRSLQNALMSGIGPLLPALTMMADLAGKLAGIIGGVLKFAVDGLVLSFNVMRQAVADSLVSLIEMIQKLPFASKIPGAEKLGEAIGFLKDQSKSAGDAIAAHLNPAMDKNAKGAETLSTRIGEYEGATRDATEANKELDPHIARLTKSFTDQIAAHEKLSQSLGKVAPTYESFRIPVSRLVTDIPLLSSSLGDTAKATSEAEKQTAEWVKKNLQVVPAMHSSSESLKKLGQSLGDTGKQTGIFGEIFGKLGPTILSAIQGGGDVGKSIGSMIGNSFGSFFSQKAASATSGFFSTKLGGVLEKMMPGLGALAGQLMGAGMSKAMGWIKGLFSDPMKKEIKAANNEIDKLKDAMLDKVGGSVDELEARYNAMGLSIREAFGGQGKQGLEALKAAQDEFNKRVEESKVKLDEMKGKLSSLQGELGGLISKAYEMGYVFNQQGELIGFNFDKVAQVAKDFGVDLSALGPAFQQAQLTAEAQKVIDAFTLLTKSGADVGGVLVGMKDEINKIVNDSIQFGTTIPANMKPMIEELIRTGQLTDKNGDKFTDLTKIKFGEPVKTEYEKINGAIETILTAMKDLIGKIDSLVSAIDAATKPRTVEFNAQYNDPGPPPGWGGGDPTDGGDELGYATGTMGRFGRWFANFGSGTKTTLHGNEAVVRADQAAAFAADMGGGGDMGGAVIASEIAAMRGEMMSILPRAIARSVRDALLVAG